MLIIFSRPWFRVKNRLLLRTLGSSSLSHSDEDNVLRMIVPIELLHTQRRKTKTEGVGRDQVILAVLTKAYKRGFPLAKFRSLVINEGHRFFDYNPPTFLFFSNKRRKKENRHRIELMWWMRSSRVVTESGCQCQSRNRPGFIPSILRHSGIWGWADEAVLINVPKKRKNPSPPPFKKRSNVWYVLANLSKHLNAFSPFNLTKTANCTYDYV